MNTLLQTVPIDQVETRKQVRRHMDPVALKELAASIASAGLQHPPLCSIDGTRFLVIDGERRLRACRDLLAWKDLPILVVQNPVDAVNALTRQLICNLQHLDLDPMERAEGIRDLMQGGGLTGDAASKSLGLSAGMVTRSVGLLKLPEPLQRQVATGEISANAGYMLSRIEDPEEQARLAAEVTGKRLSCDALARKLKRSRQAESTRARGPTRVTAMLGNGRSVTLAGKGLSLDAVIDWLDQLLARAKKAKAQSLSLETFARAMKDQATKGATA